MINDGWLGWISLGINPPFTLLRSMGATKGTNGTKGVGSYQFLSGFASNFDSLELLHVTPVFGKGCLCCSLCRLRCRPNRLKRMQRHRGLAAVGTGDMWSRSACHVLFAVNFQGAVVEIGGYICDASARQVQNSEEELVQLPGCKRF